MCLPLFGFFVAKKDRDLHSCESPTITIPPRENSMALKDYPRPPHDTGIGIHWSPGPAGAVGAGDLRDKWIPLLQKMGVKWVKLLHLDGIDFSEMLLEAGIMPIVRLYRHRPNSRDLRKAVLDEDAISYIKDYLAAGVRYFEFNNEPELSSEWEGGNLPEDAIDYVARAAIVDMETILGLGGYPAVPATAISTQWDLIGKIIEHGGDYLFDEPVWLAIHNYDINHPLNYPYDRVNRRGEQLSPQEYRALGSDAWTGSSWETRTLAFVNTRRKKDKNPRTSIHKDPSSFLAYQRLADLSMKHLGKHLPILSTENGPIVGEDPDPRYPTTTPESHAQKVVEMAKIMMGNSQRYDAAPDYYFCTAFWLLGASILRAKGWDSHAWFSPRWPGGQLPAVEALMALPKQVREFSYDEDEHPSIPHLGERARSVVSGVIHGYPNMRVILRAAGHAADTYTDAKAHFRLEHLPAGRYRLSVPGADIVHLGIELDGKNHVELTLGQPPTPAPPQPTPSSGWKVQIEDMGASQGLSVIRVSVENRRNLPVHISADGWMGYSKRTGSKKEYGPFALEFAPLGPGDYLIEPEGLGTRAQVRLESNQTLMVTFHPAPAPKGGPKPKNMTAQGQISGNIHNGAGLRVELSAPGLLHRQNIANGKGIFKFKGLPAGEYTLRLPDLDLTQTITLAQGQKKTITLDAPKVDLPHYSTLSGRITHGAGRTVLLKGAGLERSTQVGEDEWYRFEHLGPGQYYIRVQDTLLRRGGLKMTGRNHRQVNFALPAADAAESVIFGQVPQSQHWQLYVRGPHNLEIVQPLDETGHFEIDNLEAGDYELILQTPEADYIEHVTVDGMNRQQVQFALSPEPVLRATQIEIGNAPATPWHYQVQEAGPGPGFGVIRVRAPGRPGLAVRLWADGWTGMIRQLGSTSALEPDSCDFSPLGAGRYYLQAAGMEQIIELDMPGGHEIWVTLAPEPTPEKEEKA